MDLLPRIRKEPLTWEILTGVISTGAPAKWRNLPQPFSSSSAGSTVYHSPKRLPFCLHQSIPDCCLLLWKFLQEQQPYDRLFYNRLSTPANRFSVCRTTGMTLFVPKKTIHCCTAWKGPEGTVPHGPKKLEKKTNESRESRIFHSPHETIKLIFKSGDICSAELEPVKIRITHTDIDKIMILQC